MHLWLELGSYCFSPSFDVGLVENVAENIQGRKQFAKFRMLQIEEGKFVYHIYTLVTLTFRTKVILLCRLGIQWYYTLGHALDTAGVILCLA